MTWSFAWHVRLNMLVASQTASTEDDINRHALPVRQPLNQRRLCLFPLEAHSLCKIPRAHHLSISFQHILGDIVAVNGSRETVQIGGSATVDDWYLDKLLSKSTKKLQRPRPVTPLPLFVASQLERQYCNRCPNPSREAGQQGTK